MVHDSDRITVIHSQHVRIGNDGDIINVDDIVTVKIQRLTFHLLIDYKTTDSVCDSVRVAGGMISIEASMKVDQTEQQSSKRTKSAFVKKRRKDIVDEEPQMEMVPATKKKKSKQRKQHKS